MNNEKWIDIFAGLLFGTGLVVFLPFLIIYVFFGSLYCEIIKNYKPKIFFNDLFSFFPEWWNAVKIFYSCDFEALERYCMGIDIDQVNNGNFVVKRNQIPEKNWKKYGF